MAIRRKRRNQTEDVDPLGGFSLEELMGLSPVSEVEKKVNPVVKLIRLPFSLAGSVIRLPFRLLGALVPKRRRGKEQGD